MLSKMLSKQIPRVLSKYMCTGVESKLVTNLQDIPRPRGIPFIGTVLSLMAAGSSPRLHKYIDKRHKELGPLFRESVGPVDAIFVSDPEIMRTVFTRLEGKCPDHILPQPWIVYNEKYDCKRGLFFMSGDEWLHYRRILNKLLLSSECDSWIGAPISMAADDFIKKWKVRSSTIEFTPNLELELYRVSLDAILALTLGSAYNDSREKFENLLMQFADKVHKIFLYTSNMYVMPANFYEKLNLPVWRGFVNAVNDSLMLGKKLVEGIYNLSDQGDGLFSKMLGEGLNQEMVNRILIDLIIAAGDTTSFTTQWALYLLSSNPHIVDQYRAQSSKSADRFVNNIIKETMRLYPAAPFLTRFLHTDSELAGYRMPAGTLIVMSLYTCSRDKENFTNPLTFSPNRWSRNQQLQSLETVTCPYASIPFAVGARSCIGRKVAMVQMKEVISKVMSNFDLELLNKSPVEDTLQLVLKPKTPIKILIKPHVNNFN